MARLAGVPVQTEVPGVGILCGDQGSLQRVLHSAHELIIHGGSSTSDHDGIMMACCELAEVLSKLVGHT